MSLLGQMKQGFAKALQIASDNALYNELPECSVLSTVDKLSIKAANQIALQNAMDKYFRSTDVHFTIKFLIRNEKAHKSMLMTADLISGRGFVVRNSGGGHIMDVKLPNKVGDALGKIVHPSQATLFKVERLIRRGFVVRNSGGGHIMDVKLPNKVGDALGKIVHPSQATLFKVVMANRTVNGSNYHIYKTGIEQPLILIEKVYLSLYPLAKMVGLLDCECVYWFRKPDRTILGYIRPKLVLSGRTVVIKFTATQTDAQLRAAMLGATLLIILHEVYPEIKRMLEASIEEAKLSPI
uniref:THUMP domain-containing protein n=2 Tax=Ascaris lumbricoides TaxID=6252 RepID=A0A0M3IDN2_ASCLU